VGIGIAVGKGFEGKETKMRRPDRAGIKGGLGRGDSPEFKVIQFLVA